ncbi:sugar dehydrogenase complex small subunit [Alloyangia pacifica]|uniref:Membrane bound FAD containing D-sorbitol dehydrogenase n=1 Tax=Alloyangia pacifica TaxID=311180 RepID=A0A1I6QFW2_9RHOB|nr:sugar dehydrogenase complex small subunit [Alloyangia pacifica]SDF89069.1 Membrane bound FAD containing D-sorbitol dehydrogenase [Alloyangia pacifica]SFS51393.1 Membrane bound FAD containing D-sorbitol dehydrogenase [Alloyangia pacifica]
MSPAPRSRRAVLGGGVSLVAMAALPGGALAASLNTARDRTMFRSILYALAGPVEVAPQLLESVTALFEAKFGASAVDVLAAHAAQAGVAPLLEPQEDASREAQLQWLTEALFTGTADPEDDDARMINYPHALGWKSLSFGKAPGLCAGPGFGYWNDEWSAA